MQQSASTKDYGQVSLERRLFHELHISKSHLPLKEFKESWQFANAVVTYFGRSSYDLILDVAGGHGALGMILLILTEAKEAVVIDPAPVRSENGIRDVWKNFLSVSKSLRYRRESLQERHHHARHRLESKPRNPEGTSTP